MNYYKRRLIVERLIAILMLALLLPAFIIVAIFIKLDGGPVFFTQGRLGKDARVYKVIKFRTMITHAEWYLDLDGQPIRNRVTPVGRFLRLFSIDELPQLINIIRGEMALIGPRPILPKMLPYITPNEAGRFACLPGITGLAQIKGRNVIRWSKRFKYDVFYTQNISFLLDSYIVFQTIKVVLTARDISLDVNSKDVDDVTIRTALQHA